MQIDTQRFLRMAEKTGQLVTFDIESLGLHGDYGTVACASVKPFGQKPTTYSVKQIGNDIKVVKDMKEALEAADCWLTYYGKIFDIRMINTRLLKHGIPPVEKRPHVDLYWVIRSATNTTRRSQGHLVNWLQLPEEKMSVSADTWATLGTDTKEKLKILVKRCESDVTGLEQLYERTKHLVVDIRR